MTLLDDKITNLEKLSAQLNKQAAAAAAATVLSYIGLGLFALNILTPIIEKIRENTNLKDSIDKIVKNLEDYRESYSFKPYETQFEEFLADIKNLQTTYEKINANANDPKVIENLYNFLELSSKVQSLGSSISVYLDNMKNIAGKAFDFIREFRANLSLNTDATAVQTELVSLGKELAVITPVLQRQLIEAIEKSKAAHSARTQATTPMKGASSLEDLSEITF